MLYKMHLPKCVCICVFTRTQLTMQYAAQCSPPPRCSRNRYVIGFFLWCDQSQRDTVPHEPICSVLIRHFIGATEENLRQIASE